MASETFSPSGDLRPDWSAAANWSAGSGGIGAVPGAGTQAVINGIDAWIDPETTLSAVITLEGGAGLIGNDAGFSFTPSATLYADDRNALFGNGAIVNDGTIEIVSGSLTVVVQAGNAIARSYGLLESNFENLNNIAISGGTLAIEGSEFSNPGTVFVGTAGVLSVNGGWVDGGQGAAPPGGLIDLSGGGLAQFGDGVTDQDFVFTGPGTIAFDDPADVRAIEITDFGYRDEIIAPSVQQAETLLADALTFTTALPPAETLAIVSFAGGAEIIAAANHDVPPCFARGTRILTPSGYAPVETLRLGDFVVTVTGKPRPVRWAGWRSIDLADHRRPEAVYPIRIKAGAISDHVPARDVRLSPDHALLFGGQLVPVKYLVNNATILRERGCLAVTYFHLELDRHDVILAENLGAETYLDTGNRDIFTHSGGTAWRSHAFGRGKQWNKDAYAPLCTSGPILRAVRQSLFDRLSAQGYRHRIMPDVNLFAGGRKIPRSFGMAWLPCFRLPAHSGEITIRSATFGPAEMALGPDDDEDWRELGIGLRRIRIDSRIHAPATIAAAGFHDRASGDSIDWTNGNATITVPRETRVIGLNILALPKAWLVMPPG
jgi:hypothetical protein